MGREMQAGWFLLGLAILGGALVAGQGAINGRMAAAVGHPLQAAVISFSVGFVALAFLSLATGAGLPQLARALAAPWWAWVGGLLGAYLVATAAFAVPKIGASAWVAGVIAGQLVAALLYDHFGAFGLPKREIDLTRLGGVVFLGLGIWMMRR